MGSEAFDHLQRGERSIKHTHTHTIISCNSRSKFGFLKKENSTNCVWVVGPCLLWNVYAEFSSNLKRSGVKVFRPSRQEHRKSPVVPTGSDGAKEMGSEACHHL